MSLYHVEHGDCLPWLRTLDAASVDAVVSDVPSGIAFMGAEWDRDKGGRRAWVDWMREVLAECLRVTKPGGWALIWALPRTSHWTGTALEEAGWQVRDQVYHIFGSGFPKSLDASKALDKRRHDIAQIYKVTAWVAQARDEAGLSNKAIDDAFGFKGMAGHWTSQKSQPSIPTLEQVPALVDLLGQEPPEDIRRLLVDLNGKKGQPGAAWFERKVIGAKRGGMGSGKTFGMLQAFAEPSARGDEVLDITAPATEAAQRWEGYGTALKPAAEVWWLARAPMAGTLARNIEEHGAGALNLDGCRVETCDRAGRWPPHLLLTHSAECGKRCAPGCPVQVMDEQSGGGVSEYFPRFRYSPKPGSAERNAGCEHLPCVDWREDVAGCTPRSGQVYEAVGRAGAPRGNHHPTLKGIDLMRWLVRLVLPPGGGLVLDPFTGSGTTGIAALLEGGRFLGCEQDADYQRIALARLAHWAGVEPPEEVIKAKAKAGKPHQRGLFNA